MNALGKHPHLEPPWRCRILEPEFSTETYPGRLSLHWWEMNRVWPQPLPDVTLLRGRLFSAICTSDLA